MIQTATDIPIEGHQCKVTINKKVTRCGHNSLQYGSQWPVFDKQIHVSAPECRKAVEEGFIRIEGRDYKCEKGRRTKYHYWSHGHLDAEGNCEHVSFMSGGTQFHKSYEWTYIEIYVKRLHGTWDQSTGDVVFSTGLRGLFRDGIAIDDLDGIIVWEPISPPCHDTVSEIYLGPAMLHRRHGDDVRESIIMIANNKSDQYAGLILKKPHSVCDMHCYRTQVRGLMVCLLRELDAPIAHSSFRAAFDPTTSDIESQISHLHIGTNLRLTKGFADTQSNICTVEQRALFNKLQAISGTDNHHALLDIYGPGHFIATNRNAAYISRCPAIDVARADFANCTQEVPVSVNGSLRFADPFTWILQDFPTIVPMLGPHAGPLEDRTMPGIVPCRMSTSAVPRTN